MKFSEETLMAYVDQQLDADTRAAVEAAMAMDSELARRVARHVALAGNIRAAFDPVLRETVPVRLLNAVAASAERGATEVIDLAQQRQAQHSRPVWRWSWPQWGAIAASLVVGVIAGRFSGPDIEPVQFAMADGRMVARGTLEHALSAQLASAQPDNAPVRIGISFMAKSGEYCRTFALAQGSAGLACRTGKDWRLQVLAQAAAAPPATVYRMAGSDMPSAVMREVEAAIVGSPLDATEEQSARQRAWRR